ncbi:MAG TPA: polysaccharide biosynthesis tyrosine autokinase, partial [Pedobacter sp.]
MNHKYRSSPISYYKLLKVVLSRWYWILFTVFGGMVICFFYVLLTPREYRSSGSLKFEDKKSEISELLSVRNLYDRTNKVESEKNTILSRTVLTAAVLALDYRLVFFENCNFQMKSTYPIKPIEIKLITGTFLAKTRHRFKYKRVNEDHYELCLKSEDSNYCKVYRHKEPIKILGNLVAIQDHRPTDSANDVFFEIMDPDNLIVSMRKAIKIDDSQNTNILSIKYIGNNSTFSTDIVNAILDEYIKYDVKQKQDALSQTSKFLNILLHEISSKAQNSASAIQSFKEANDLFDINLVASENQVIIEKIRVENHLLELDAKVLKFVANHINSNPYYDIATYNLQGLTDPQLNGLVQKYQELMLLRREKLNVYTESSGPVIFLDDQIKYSKDLIIKSLSEHISLNAERSKNLTEKKDSIKAFLRTLPQIETTALKLSSSYEVDQKVQGFIAQKKLESQIVNAAITPIATILDRASYPTVPLSPIANSCYLVAMICGFIAGTFAIITVHLYNPFIYTKEHIEALSPLPILGVVNKFYRSNGFPNKEIVLQDFPRSAFSESIRFIRGNLNFIAPAKGKVICITSEVSGEGKSFISINLAYALTLIQKKVILIAGDLRKSSLHTSFGLNNLNGLSKYLSGQTDIELICTKTSIRDLDLVPSGPIPPNPSELLQSAMMSVLLEELKLKYDVILIDSAPIGLVSDIKPVMKLADINLFILRSGISKPGYAQTPEKLRKDLELTSVAIVLNDFKSDNFHNHYY